ncbi:hypothetical protein NV379_07465 [Paenibacillus sp. N1-5-1-14]|uniref:hypothetical protein n=1 Tax=Paenibacillus radicibacter TaxID=2972488 RepID=UPI002158D464|nr:hypothetical protein [Paenibacillus radicibacter]MCR8642500.1 hypothetical protein [Paenibacillus radicibacter]
MGGKFLDSQISQNGSFTGSVGIGVTSTPALFGTLGLITSGAGAHLRVQFTATVTVSSLVSVLTPVTIQIFRGTGVGATLVYSATESLPLGLLVLSETVFTATGCDYQPPNPDGFLIYQAFVSIPAGLAILPVRTGPESFNAAAYSD